VYVIIYTIIVVQPAGLSSERASKGDGMTNDSRDLVLLVYTPREDSNARGYEDWLREIDNPFFNSVPGIRHYTNWRVASAADCAFPYTHFDFMYLDDADSVAKVWSNEDLLAFAQGWTEKWGRYPDATQDTMHMNYQVYLCSQVSGDNVVRGNDLAIMPSKGEIGAADGRQVYRIAEPMLGDVRFTHFAVDYLSSPADFESAAAGTPQPAYGCAYGTVIASPDL
jgi:hypothetical protein